MNVQHRIRKSMRGKSTVILLPAATFVMTMTAVFLAGTGHVEAQAAKVKTVWDGVYTADQAVRGRGLFEAHCVDCHKSDLSGDRGPALKGQRFMTDFEADTVERLYTHMRTLMPQNNRGSLLDDDYLHLTTYILQANDFPAGTEPLSRDPTVLRSIRIVRKGGPTEAPNFSLVRVVGCLDGDSSAWTVTGASEPVVTKDPAVSKGDDLIDAVGRPLGTLKYSLINIFDPVDSHKGHKMEVKGLLIRLPTETRINVMSVQAVAMSCVN